VRILVELPQGVVIEVRRGGHDALAQLSGDMVRLGVSGYIRIERRPKELIPRVSQVLIHDGIPKLAIHETDIIRGGLEALLEIERDSTALDALISLVELPDEDIIRITNLYPDFSLSTEDQQSDQAKADWWNYVQLNTRSWRREARLPEQEVIVEAPEYIRQLTKAKLQKFDLGEKYLNYGDTLIVDSSSSETLFNLAGILATHGRPLIVFSRSEPRMLTNDYDIPNSSCIKISSQVSDINVLPDPSLIQKKLKDFLWANKQAVVVFSGLDYLLATNEFKSIINMFRSLIDEVRLADHLLLVHCNLELMNTRERRSFSREFELISPQYLENLVMDSESVLDHPICMELSDEELSWIQQQISFARTAENIAHTGDEAMFGGAASVAEEDLTEAKEILNQVVDEWQAPTDIMPEIITQDGQLVEDTKLVSNLMETAFSTSINSVANNPEIIETPAKSKPKLAIKESKQIETLQKTKSPRAAIRIKRAKKSRRTGVDNYGMAKSSATAINRDVILPEIGNVTKIRSLRQAIDTNLTTRAEKMDAALQSMLKSTNSNNSRSLKQALNQKSQSSASELPVVKTKRNLPVNRKINVDTIVHSSSDIAKGDISKRRQRESASRGQSVIDVDKNYQKWSTEYQTKSSISDEELISYEGDDQ